LPSERDWRSWWWQAPDVRYLQFLGKDNVPFHTVSFPATLLGSGEPWKTVDVVKGFHWLTYEGGKFSTSQRRGVFTDAALKVLPSEVERRIAILRGWHEGLEFRRAAAETRALWVLANGYIQEQAPWTMIKSDPARAAVTTRSALSLLTLCAVVSWSIIPTLAN